MRDISDLEDEQYTGGGMTNNISAEIISDLIQKKSNYFPSLEEAANKILVKLNKPKNINLFVPLSEYLSSEHNIRVATIPPEIKHDTIRYYDPVAKTLVISDRLPQASRTFLVAQQMGLLLADKEINEILDDNSIEDGEVRKLGRLALSNYFAGAIILPYDNFFEQDLCGTCTACIDDCPTGAIVDAYLYEEGSDYGSETLNFEKVPKLTVTSGSGAAVSPIIINGRIENAFVQNGGSGYTSPPTVTINGDGTGATAQATLTGTSVTGVTVTSAGSGYTFADIVLTGGGGANAEADAVLGSTDTPTLQTNVEGTAVKGTIDNIVVTNQGSDYTSGDVTLKTPLIWGF